MPHTYPPAAPTISSDVLTISRFLNTPTLVNRRLRTLVENRFIADVLLSGRIEAEGGAVLYEQSESIFTSRAPEAVNPGAEYPRATAAPGTGALAGVTKWGQDVPVTDEHVRRFRGDAVQRALTKISNFMIKQVDTVALAAIAAAVTATQAASAVWTGASANILLDIELAVAKVTALDNGYEPDTLATTDEGYARIIADSKIISGLTREGVNSPTLTGDVPMIGGLRILATNNLPTGVKALVVDSAQLGSLAYERLGSPEYTGDPASGVETWSRRDPDANDQWLLRGRRPVVPIVQEPGAGIAITGTGLT